MKIRYLPSKSFPEYVFVPGENPHPKKSGGHMEGENDPVVPLIDQNKPHENEALRYSLDLYNHGYFWESHVYFEALWNAHGRTGPVADFLKGMIKLGAAGVKKSLRQDQSSEGHLKRAQELFLGVIAEQGNPFLGFNLEKVASSLAGSREIPPVHPEWE